MTVTEELLFRVSAPEIATYEHVAVVGNIEELGKWNYRNAVTLTCTDCTRTEWEGRVQRPSNTPNGDGIRYRYFLYRYCARDMDLTSKIMLITRWECCLNPRNYLPNSSESDVFGAIDTKSCGPVVDFGWLTEQTEIRFRLFGSNVHFWKQKYVDRQFRMIVEPIDLRYKEPGLSDNTEEDESMDAVSPHCPSHTETKVLVLKNKSCFFEPQRPFGERIAEDNLILMFKTQTVSPNFLAFRFTFFMEEAPGVEPRKMGSSFFLPANFKETSGSRTIPISGLNHLPVGQVAVDYLVIQPMENIEALDQMDASYTRHWKRRRTVEVGHRGLGNSYSCTQFAAVRENTIASLSEAASHGADFVEFDVHLSKDLIPVIYHDFFVCINLKRKHVSNGHSSIGQDWLDYELHEVPIKELDKQQLRLLKLNHPSEKNSDGSEKKRNFLDEEERDHQPFPELGEVLKSLPSYVGVNIEIKYPMMEKSGKWECDHFFERNVYVDKVLEQVFLWAGERRVIFSSFEPDICSIVKLKQNRYPMLFLTQGLSTRYNPFTDERANCHEIALSFANANNLLGVNFHSEDLLRDSKPLLKSHELGLVSFVWGDDLNDFEVLKKFKELGADGLIYDRISANSKGKPNVFLMEARVKEIAQSEAVPVASS